MFDKKFLYIGGGVVAVLVIVLVIIGFSGKNNKNPEANQSPTNKIVVWDSFDDEYTFKDIFGQYEKDSGVEIEFVKKDPSKYETESVEALASGNGPDVWIIPNNWMPKHHDKLAEMPEKTMDPEGKKANNDVYKETYVPAALSDNVIADKVYGFPLFMDSLALFYNPKLMQAKYDEYARTHPSQADRNSAKILVEAPKTWDGLVDFVKLYGENAIALGGSTKTQNSGDILTALMLQYGAKMTSDDNSGALFQTAANQFTDEAYPGTRALEFYTSFAKRGDQHYTWNKDNDAYVDFANNKVAMMINYARMINDLTKNSQNLKVTALPQVTGRENGITLSSYQVLTVPKSSKNQEKAWALISFLCSDSISNSYQTITKLNSPLKKDPKLISNDIKLQNQTAQSWYNPDPAKVKTIFEGAIDQVLGGNKAQTVLEGAAAQVTTLLGQIKR